MMLRIKRHSDRDVLVIGIDKLLTLMRNKNQEIELKLKNKIRLMDCIDTLTLTYDGEDVRLVFNFYTLDIINISEIPRNLAKDIFVATEEAGYMRNSRRVERRAFCEYLLLKYGDEYDEIQFIDRESPDYILYDGERKLSFEVVEAINTLEAQFNTMCRKNTGRGKSKEEYVEYADQKHKKKGKFFSIEEFEGNIILSPNKGMINTSGIRNQIVDAATNKARKYREYDINSDEKNILITYSSIGFDNEMDFAEVGKKISEIELILTSDINRIFVVSKMYGILVEYSKTGDILNVIADKIV